MNTNTVRYVNVPDLCQLTDNQLNYLDALIYMSLRSFDGSDGCFPMHETIAKLAGMSKRFVIESIKRLEGAQLVTVLRSQKKKISNEYSFKSQSGSVFKATHPIPVELLNVQDLSSNEKAMLICLRHLFNHGRLQCAYSISDLSKYLGLTRDTIRKQIKGLVEKRYICKRLVRRRNAEKHNEYWVITNKIEWPPEKVSNAIPTITYSTILNVA